MADVNLVSISPPHHDTVRTGHTISLSKAIVRKSVALSASLCNYLTILPHHTLSTFALFLFFPLPLFLDYPSFTASSTFALFLVLPSLLHCIKHLSLASPLSCIASNTFLLHCVKHLSLASPLSCIASNTSLLHCVKHLSIALHQTPLSCIASNTSLLHCVKHLSLALHQTPLSCIASNTSLLHCVKHLSLALRQTPLSCIVSTTSLLHCIKHLSLALCQTPLSCIASNTSLLHCIKHLSLPLCQTPLISFHPCRCDSKDPKKKGLMCGVEAVMGMDVAHGHLWKLLRDTVEICRTPQKFRSFSTLPSP